MTERLTREDLRPVFSERISLVPDSQKAHFVYFWAAKLKDGSVVAQIKEDGTDQIIRDSILDDIKAGNVVSLHWVPFDEGKPCVGYIFEPGDAPVKTIGLFSQGFINNLNVHKGHIYFLGRQLEDGSDDLVVLREDGSVSFSDDRNKIEKI